MTQMKIGIIGAGTMGHGIAHVAALAGFQVVLFDSFEGVAKKGLAQVQKNLEMGVSKQKLTIEQKDSALAQIMCASHLNELATCDWVIEAIPEKLELKQALFSQLEKICRPQTLFGTNTSSLSVTTIASGLENRGRLIGLHFFNPVHLMKLVEIVKGDETSAATLENAKQLALALKKESIVVRDVPGFASSRLGVACGLEAIRMLEENVASAADIDKAMELGYAHPMGPLKLGDLVGLDVRLSIAEYIFEQTKNPVFRPPELLKKMVASGKLGKKSGEGFYKY
jgi:3-hydroxybutyryl-CoA dehydrogenase